MTTACSPSVKDAVGAGEFAHRFTKNSTAVTLAGFRKI
jgi:hypothetical protein